MREAGREGGVWVRGDQTTGSKRARHLTASLNYKILDTAGFITLFFSPCLRLFISTPAVQGGRVGGGD